MDVITVMHIGGFSGEFHGGTYIAFFNTTVFSLENDFFSKTNATKNSLIFAPFVTAMFVVQMGAAKSFTRSPQGCYDLCLLLWRTIPLLFLQGVLVSLNFIIPLYGGGVLIALIPICPYIYWFKKNFFYNPNSGTRHAMRINERTVSEILRGYENENGVDPPHQPMSERALKETIDHVFNSDSNYASTG